MSVRVMADVWDYGPDDPVDNSVLLRLANHCNDEGRNCFPSITDIARAIRRSDKTVSRSISQLEDDGWITVKRGVGKGNMSQYIVNIERLKGGQSDLITQSTKRGLSVLQKETLCPPKGDSHGKPPHPLIRVTISEPSKEPSIPSLAPKGKIVIPSFVDPEVWLGFTEMRKDNGWPLKGRALTLIINKLERIHAAGGDPNAALDQSTERCYRGLFEPDQPGGKNGYHKTKVDNYEILKRSLANSRLGGGEDQDSHHGDGVLSWGDDQREILGTVPEGALDEAP